MKVLTLGGTRLLDAAELAVAAWAYDPKNSKKREIQKNFGWTSNCENIKYAVTAWTFGEKWDDGTQISRFTTDVDEAAAWLKQFALTNAPDFFYNENNEYKLKVAETKLKETSEKLKKANAQIQSAKDLEVLEYGTKKDIVEATVTSSEVVR